ncbi:primase-helicase family protein [Roseivivax sp. THAF30]|uniref:primase-helicase family protein n=1 Tax=Roseivivax sp. THAF30 TaxID=2587852 RepID=UPI0012684359|nr:primase-helicase family protein [Roseivivax sp. THAF30]QFT64578.1 hypothetical protein FIU91_16695 [Roseivivax sp. THAF30]
MTAHDPTLHAQPSTQNYDFWPDATVYGSIESDEAQKVLDSSIACLMASSHRTPGHKWERAESTVRELLDGLLGSHPVRRNKHGRTIVYSDAQMTGKTVNGLPYAYRLKKHITAISAVTIDVDGSDKATAVRDRLIALGQFSVIYTTHSHAAKRTVAGDRFRVVVFLETPYVLPMEDAARRQAVREWENRYAGFAELLGLSEIDASGMRLQQIMHPPGRPSEDAEFLHFIIAGRALRWEDMPMGDASKYKKPGPSFTGTRTAAKADSAPAILSDGFDLRAWFDEAGETFLLTSFLDYLGWDDRGDAGKGRVILCPNDAAHTDAGNEEDTGCWACEAEGADGESFVITCQHNSCSGVHTWDMIKLIEDSILDGTFALPDGWDTLSTMLCDECLHVSVVDGEEIVFDPADFGARREIEIEFIGSVHKAKRALKGVVEDGNAGEVDFAALYAGAEKAGNKIAVVQHLDAALKEHFDANTAKRLKKMGKDMLADERSAWGQRQAAQRKEAVVEALADPQPANVSLDIAEPLGDTLAEALGTLKHRFVLADVAGKFRVIRRPDLAALRDNGRTLKSILIAQTPEDFINFHKNRRVRLITDEGVQEVSPAAEFLANENRKSGVVFEPDETRLGDNEFNLYAGRTLEADPDACGLRIAHFIWDVICDRRDDLFRWLILWMAHKVQRPGEKPQSAVVVWGKGGCGKSTLGSILERLSHPHCRTLDKSEHVVGRFAGEHLATTICAICTEAAFAGDPKVARELKSLVTSPEIPVEPKGLPVMQMPSFLRLYFDSNSPHAVPIEGNGSERRYLVMKVAERMFVDLEEPESERVDYWRDLYAAINGPEMGGFLHALLKITPEDLGLKWDDVRRPPSTPERDGMRWQSLRPAQRALALILEAGEIELMGADFAQTHTFGPDEPIRLPIAALREYLVSKGNRHNANDNDPEALALETFAEIVAGDLRMVTTGRGKLTGMIDGKPASAGNDNVRWIEFPSRRVMVEEIASRFNRPRPDVSD